MNPTDIKALLFTRSSSSKFETSEYVEFACGYRFCKFIEQYIKAIVIIVIILINFVLVYNSIQERNSSVQQQFNSFT
jgi:hypothetical protein